VTTPSLRATPADVPHSITETAREIPVVGHTDVLVVGGGPAGVTAAVAAARQGASVTLLERYNHLGGLASGGMVLVLDDMVNGQEISVAGLVSEYIERLEKIGLVKVPPVHERVRSEEMWNKWGRWGVFDFHSHGFPKPITYAAAFDPDGWKRVSNDLVSEAGVNLRMHSWFSLPIVEDGVLKGAVVETKSGREARALNRQAKRILGGAWDKWWLKTPLPGVAWCNCPHMTGFDGTKVEDLTGAEFEGRRKINEAVEYVTTHMPGFQNAYLLDVAEQMGVRQTRLLTGEYVVTKEDVVTRRHFTDSVARGRDYYTPYRALLPRSVEQLLVAGRHDSATPEAQRMSREIPPCMAMGEAAGVAATVALETGRSVRDVDVHEVQRRLRAVGADPGDVPSANATIDEEPALAGAASSEGTVL
jgi:hypothetical protein